MKKLKNSKKEKTNIFWIAAIAIFLVYVLACALPAFYTENKYMDGTNGALCLFMGWMNLFAGSPLFIVWFANPLFFAGLTFTILRKKIAVYLSGTAVLFAFMFFTEHEVMINEGGSTTSITGYGSGSYFWMASIVLTFGLSLFLRISKKYR